MTARQQRMVVVALIVVSVSLGVTFALTAFQEDLLYFYSPSQIADGEAPENRQFRVGGLVIPGSVEREEGELEVKFTVTDNAHNMTVAYSGVLPDLFREGQGIIAHGVIDASGIFQANEVLAKHDENYMPPEVADSLKELHGETLGRDKT